MKIYIKYMVSHRCKLVVMSALDNMGVYYNSVELGAVKIKEKLTEQQYHQLATTLMKSGLQLMDDKKAILVEKVKNRIIEMIHYSDELPTINFSITLSEGLDYNYTYLSNLFSHTTGTTIEHFIILQKVERIKELLLYNELNIAEIADKLHYCNAAHLSKQFKKVTGLTPSYFKKIRQFRKRIVLEDL